MTSRLSLTTALILAAALALPACKKPLAPHTIGLALDVGGRGDQSFNDGALRGLEGMAAGLKSTAHGYATLTDAEYQALVPSDLMPVAHLPIPQPLVLSGKAQEDYEPNLQLLVDQGVELTIAVGFMMEPAVRAVSARNPNAKFLLVDSPVLDEAGKKPVVRPNVRAVVFREQEGSFLAGALAGELTRSGKIGFVGGMQLALIQKFEAGFRAGVRTVNPEAEKHMLVAYTGTFDDEKKGVEVGGDLYARGCDIVFHAAGLDGLGVIKAAQHANQLVIGVDSDQSRVAPRNVLTSMVKHVDVAVYQAVSDELGGHFTGGDQSLGLKEGGVGLAPLGGDVLPAIGNELKAGALADVDKLRTAIIKGRFAVPATIAELERFVPMRGDELGLQMTQQPPPPQPDKLGPAANGQPVTVPPEEVSAPIDSAQPLLELRGIGKSFAGVKAVDGVSLAVAPGEVLALVGENGAGKSTLIQVACGLYRADQGEVRMHGAPLASGDPRAAIDAGLGVVYQHFMLVGPLSVWENVVLGREPRKPGLRGMLGELDRGRARAEVLAAAQGAGLAIDVDAPTETLSVGAQQRVEIVKQLWRGARVLVLDEPTAVLSTSEAEELLVTVRRLAAEGRGVIFISHKLREVLRVADRVAVLRRGKLVLTTQAGGTSEQQLAEAVLGTVPRGADATRASSPKQGAPLLVARDLRCLDERGRPALRGLSLEVAAGELIGIAGVDGNGQAELAEVLAGLRACSGTLALEGAEGLAAHGWAREPARARQQGVVHLPADRHRFALCLPLSIEENVALGNHARAPFARGLLIDRAGRRQRTDELLREFDVRPPIATARAGALSGGNQQKLVSARELQAGPSPKLVVAVQPSRGLDFRATARVHRALLEARDAGAAVIVISLDLDELRALASRIVVMFEGRAAGICAVDASDAELGRLMLGSSRSEAAHA